ncbi:MAG: hypothetical protein OCD01_19760 [Fibrobacterales bacterium]
MIRKLIIPALLFMGVVALLSLVILHSQQKSTAISGGSITGNEVTAEPVPLKLMVPDTLPHNAIMRDSAPISRDSLAN